uniref:Uncharacterized protein n=1 Tax=Bubo bubo TaxID=30461 RepID=A0A8C0EI34_BUBBB
EVMLLEPCSSLTEGYVGSLHDNRHGSSVQIRRRKASGDPYWAYSGELTSSEDRNIKYLQNQFVYFLFVAMLRNSLNEFYSVFSSTDFLENSLYTHTLLSCLPAIYLQDWPYYFALYLSSLSV